MRWNWRNPRDPVRNKPRDPCQVLGCYHETTAPLGVSGVNELRYIYVHNAVACFDGPSWFVAMHLVVLNDKKISTTIWDETGETQETQSETNRETHIKSWAAVTKQRRVRNCVFNDINSIFRQLLLFSAGGQDIAENCDYPNATWATAHKARNNIAVDHEN